MSAELGIACGTCDSFAPLGAVVCASCGHDLTLGARRSASSQGHVAPPPSSRPSLPTLPDEIVPVPPPMTERTIRSTPTGVEATIPDRPSVSPRPAAGQRPIPAHMFEEPLRRRREGRDEPPRSVTPTNPSAVADPNADPPAHALSIEELMDQAKNFVCRSCSTPVPMGHKFCGRCGAAVPAEIMTARTQFFGQLQAPGRAKLILIRGEGVEGLSYQLNAENHAVGRRGELVFPDDPFVSPKHANFFYRQQKLVVRDEDSLNGVYVRVRGQIELAPGDLFLAGEQVFRLDGPPQETDGAEADGTFFYSSPKHGSAFRVTQILQGGALGATVCARGNSLQIGREGGDLNFPTDLYMSGTHCKIEESGGRFTLNDSTSRNGTFIRVKGERELTHGDYVFIGRKLLRVEITAA
ncbi:MAG: FHA domain-containing protein [Myxococcales bacterium]|jgi:pSer/pThr/pTyr-binding forkhead associated (FHA) protein|nr:FHA domain-containing protein [Myxococcales bacterium]